MSMFSSSTKEVETAVPTVQPQASQTYSDPAMEMASRQMLDAYFNPEYGMIGQQIPIPVQQIAGLSPQEIQARNLAGGLGGFGGQLAEAQDMYRQGSQAFDPSTAGLFADPRARALYEQSTRGYDPSMGQQFMDQDARRMMMGAAGDIRGAEQGMSREALMAQQGMRDASGQVGSAARSGQQGMGSAGDDISRAIAQAQQGMGQAGDRAVVQGRLGQSRLDAAGRGIDSDIFSSMQGMSQAGMGAGRESALGQQQIRNAAAGIGGQVGSAQQQAAQAAARARGQTEMAGRDLRSAGQMGQAAAMQGIAGLAGTGDQYDPSSASSFMDPYNRDVIDAQQAEIARLGEKQKISARDQAVKSGAFGGSRGAIAEAEIGRNVLQQQAKTGAELRSQGFQQAQQQAQQSFEQAQGRRQQAAQMTGSLGQAGAQTGISAAQQAANLGLSAEQMAQRGAFEGGQLGMTGQMNQGQLAQQAAQMGISTQELQGRLAQQSGALGLQAQQGIGGLAGQRAGIGQNLGSQFQSAQQLGSNVFGNQMNRMQGAASGMGGLTNQQMSNAMNAYQMTGANQRAGAQGIAGLGQQGYNMLSGQIGTLDKLGGTGRGIQQGGLDAQYKAGMQLADEPFMRLQRGQSLLQGSSNFMPQYVSGFDTQQQGTNPYESASGFDRGKAILGKGQELGDMAMDGFKKAAGAMSGAPAASDIRLKENVLRVDEVEPGVGWYTWDWNDTAKAMGIDDQTEGVIAQELMEVDPGAVAMGDDGYYRVDYSKVKRNRSGVQ